LTCPRSQPQWALACCQKQLPGYTPAWWRTQKISFTSLHFNKKSFTSTPVNFQSKNSTQPLYEAFPSTISSPVRRTKAPSSWSTSTSPQRTSVCPSLTTLSTSRFSFKWTLRAPSRDSSLTTSTRSCAFFCIFSIFQDF